MKKSLLAFCVLWFCLGISACSKPSEQIEADTGTLPAEVVTANDSEVVTADDLASVVVEMNKVCGAQTLQLKRQGEAGKPLIELEQFQLKANDLKQPPIGYKGELPSDKSIEELLHIVYDGFYKEYEETHNSELLDKLMYVAILIGDGQLVRRVLDIGGNANGSDPVFSPLMMAALYSCVDCTKVLIEADGTDVNRRVLEGASAFDFAIHQGNRLEDAQIVEMLVKTGIDVSDSTKLKIALFDCPACLDRIVKFSPNVNVNGFDDSGYTPLMIASVMGMVYSMQILIDAGADVNAISSDGQSVLMMALLAPEANATLLLLKNGADPNINTVNSDGKSLSDLAAERECTNCRDFGFKNKTELINKARANRIEYK